MRISDWSSDVCSSDLLWLMTGLFAVGVFSYVHHGNPIRSLDLVSRYLMAVPVSILLVHHRPKAEWMWAGVIVGCLSAAGVTIWQTVVLNLPSATGDRKSTRLNSSH